MRLLMLYNNEAIQRFGSRNSILVPFELYTKKFNFEIRNWNLQPTADYYF